MDTFPVNTRSVCLSRIFCSQPTAFSVDICLWREQLSEDDCGTHTSNGRTNSIRLKVPKYQLRFARLKLFRFNSLRNAYSKSSLRSFWFVGSATSDDAR